MVMVRTQVLVQRGDDLVLRLDAAATIQIDKALRYALEIRW